MHDPEGRDLQKRGHFAIYGTAGGLEAQQDCGLQTTAATPTAIGGFLDETRRQLVSADALNERMRTLIIRLHGNIFDNTDQEAMVDSPPPNGQIDELNMLQRGLSQRLHEAMALLENLEAI
jgi:hypothetical protein